jgi:hypothetical protein
LWGYHEERHGGLSGVEEGYVEWVWGLEGGREGGGRGGEGSEGEGARDDIIMIIIIIK